jgi:hypothetical protein
MKKSKLGMLVLFLLISTGYWGVSNAVLAWPVENGVAISTAAGDQGEPKLATDNDRGAIIVWWDNRNSSSTTDIYAQSINHEGSNLWPADGACVCSAAGIQYAPQIISDGHRGAIITWEDDRNSISTTDIYAQAIDSSGTLKWEMDGIAVCTTNGIQRASQIISDDAGGCVIAWYDFRNGINNSDIYVQAINANGTVKWTNDGVPVCTYLSSQDYPQLVTDGQGGAIIVWQDHRNGGSNFDVYAQAIDSTGALKWAENGIALCTAANNQHNPQLVADGQGGAIITWEDYRSTTLNPEQGADIYAQAIDSTGNVKWTANGIAVCTVMNDQWGETLVPDGKQGAIITWQDYRNTTFNAEQRTDIYCQAVDSSGSLKWAINGVSVCTAFSHQYGRGIISDLDGGAVLTWFDYRNDINYDVYAQAVNKYGIVKWNLDGISVCTAIGNQYPSLVSDNQGGAIIAWSDKRNGVDYDIYAQSISSDGIVPVELSQFYYEPK